MQSFPLSALTMICLAASVPAAAQSSVHTPKSGSPERQAIMDTLRGPVESDLHRSVIFVVRNPARNFRVLGDWAFVDAVFRQPSGAPLPRRFFAAHDYMLSDDAVGLLHRVDGRWHIIAHATGPTDVVEEDWTRKYHAPPGLVPHG